MKKKIYIIQSFLKHVLYTSLVHQTPLRMRQIAPNCTIFFKIFCGGKPPRLPPPSPPVASPLRGLPRAEGAPFVQLLAMSLQPLAKILVEALSNGYEMTQI